MNPHYKQLHVDLDANDWRFLNYLSHRYVAKTQPFITAKGTFEQYKDFFLKNSDTDYKQQPIFAKIAGLFKEGTSHSTVEQVYEYSQVSLVNSILVPHKDSRKCVISIPLVPVSPVSWYTDTKNSGNRLLHNIDDCVEIDSYDYRWPVSLVNTEVYHGVPNNTTPRIFFQVGGFSDTFAEVSTHLK